MNMETPNRGPSEEAKLNAPEFKEKGINDAVNEYQKLEMQISEMREEGAAQDEIDQLLELQRVHKQRSDSLRGTAQ